MDGLSLYIHIPFCRSKCIYCDFNSYAGLEDLFEPYTAAVVREIGQADVTQLNTIYIGGGTPTVLPPSLLARILDAARCQLNLAPGAEVSIEANPSALDAAGLGELCDLGVNRLSLGVQSLDDAELQMLGRIHTAAEAAETIAVAREAGFDNLSLDLIYGLPHQSLERWSDNLQQALALEPDHLSLYALSVEETTPLAVSIARNELPDPNPDLAAEMYTLAAETLAKAGFAHYEISNWARTPEHMCQHNLVYWRNTAYLGLGAGAHSWQNYRRWSNLASPRAYSDQVLTGGSPVGSHERIGPNLEMGETMMMGLRLLDEGVGFGRFRERFGIELQQQYEPVLPELQELGLIEILQNRIRLSRRGHLLGNQVFAQFLPDSP